MSTDRRAFLAAAPALALLTAGPARAASGADPGFAECVARFRTTDARAAAFDKTAFGPAHDKWQALCEAIPHYETKSGFDVNGTVMHLRTDRTVDVRVARDFIHKRNAPADGVFSECVAELAQAVEHREAQALG